MMGTSIPIGSTLGRYRVVAQLGEGGMGEVYLARDTQLEREVALKILPPALAANGERMSRFRQEARAAAALNHPSIAHIYEIGEAAGVNFIALEYVEGETLNAAIHRDSTGLSKLLKYLSEVADGLAKAHAAGIVHRDLKPDNVMIARDGYAKILDFGLAKLVEPADAREAVGNDPNEAATAMIRPRSSPGVVMGTVGYMSPEQAQGKTEEIDGRSDIFSFGCILYEVATGRRPFEGDSLIQSLHKLVYENAPPVAEFNPHAPSELQRIIRRCLAKDRDERYQSIKDVAIELRELRRVLDDGANLDRTATPEANRPTNVGDATLLLTDAERAARTSGRGTATTASDGKSDASRAAGTTSSSLDESRASGSQSSGDARASDVAHEASAGRSVAPASRRRFRVIVAALALLVAVAVVGAYLYRARSSDAIESVAVLPLANATNDANADWLSDGITESVIYKLSQVPDLKVIARSTVFRYKGRDVDPAQAARELGVRAILSGRFVERGDDLAVSVELVDTREGKVLWGERFERKVADANAIQQEITREVSDKLRPQMSGTERGQMAKSGTSNTEAYQLYLKGRYYWNKRTEDDLTKSIDFFQQAVALDPNYAQAYAGLADAYQTLPAYTDLPPEETYLKSKPAAQKAIELDPTLAEPHAALGGDLSEYDRDFSGAERELRRALELNPNYATGHQWYGEFLGIMGRFDEAINEAKRAQELDPQSPIINTMLGEIYREGRRYDEAVAQFHKTLELDPNFAQAHSLLSAAYEAQGKYEEMIEEARKAAILFGAPPDKVEKRAAANLAAYRAGGKHGYWQSELELTQKGAQARGDEPPPDYLAMIYTQLGDKEHAFAELEKAYRKHLRLLDYLKVDSIWDPLRSDPRFADLMRRVGLPQ